MANKVITEWEWNSRYSDTMEPDKIGRWARIMKFKEVTFAWISRMEINNKIIYSCKLYFPTLKNDTANDFKTFSNFDEAKEWCENQFINFRIFMQNGK